MEYLWKQAVRPPTFAPLTHNLTADVLVIGGGMAGIACAALLTQAGVQCVLAEANQIGNGITKGTTAVLTAQHDILYREIAELYGTRAARQYLQTNLHALRDYRRLAQGIDCDLERLPSVMYSQTDGARLRAEAELLQKLDFPAQFTKRLPFAVAGAVKFPDMGQFHPLKFLYGLSQKLAIYENTRVQTLRGTTAVTAHGNKIHAKKVIVATHFPFLDRRGLYFVKQFQRRSYVIAYKNVPQLDCTYSSGDTNGFFLRSYKNLLLVGGGDHRTGRQGGGFDAVTQFTRRYFPDAREVLRWANQDCVTLDGIPYIGAYSPAMPDVLTATGFGLWGMTTSMVAARVLSDMVQGKDTSYADVFAPNRSMLHTQLFKNLGETFANFVRPTAPRCTHLGCALRWNAQEHSWDCPCHGSRFSESGALLDTPAQKRARP